MSDNTTTVEGSAGDPTAVLSAALTGGCCGNPPQADLHLPEPTAAATPCCGTAAEAGQAGSCCGTAAKQDAIATGRGCCG